MRSRCSGQFLVMVGETTESVSWTGELIFREGNDTTRLVSQQLCGIVTSKVRVCRGPASREPVCKLPLLGKMTKYTHKSAGTRRGLVSLWRPVSLLRNSKCRSTFDYWGRT